MNYMPRYAEISVPERERFPVSRALKEPSGRAQPPARGRAALLSERPPKQEHVDGFAKALVCAGVLCPPAEVQCNFVAFKGCASVIMVMERVNV